jgi:hypothetical protein
MCDTPLREMPGTTCVTSNFPRLRRFLDAGLPAKWSVILFLVLATSLRAQERVRTVFESPLIQAYRRSPQAFFYLGPFQEELQGTAAVQYTDNVQLTNTNKISDLSFTQALSLNSTWVISHLNQLQFNFGGQLIENFYGNGRSRLNFAVDPTSKIEFKIEVSDFKIRLFDNFSYSQNPTTDPTATNTANLNSLTNTIGAVVDADLNRAIISLAADYTYNNTSGTNTQGQTNPTTSGTRESYRVGPYVTFQLSPTILYGFNVTATRSTSSDAASVNSLNFGPFINGKLTRELEFDFAVGGTLADTKPAIPPGYYFSAVIRYLVNKHWQILFSGSHDLVFTSGNYLTEENLFQLGTQLGITRFITFSLSPFVNFGDVKSTGLNTGSLQGSNYTQFGFEAGLEWKLRKRWSTTLTYGYIRRESGAAFGTGTTASQNYIQNTIALSIGYAF